MRMYKCGIKPGPHQYANANETCGTAAYLNKCPILAKSCLFGIRLVKCSPSIANVFFFEVPTPNG